jgi:hypothetical protein
LLKALAFEEAAHSGKDLPVSDIFQEVEEEVRRERLEKLWKKYGDYFMAGAAVVIIGVGGFKLWQHYEFVRTTKAAATYLAAQDMSASSRNSEAADVYAKLARTAPDGYAKTASLAQAGALLASGKKDEAVALYRKLFAADDGPIGQTARIRAAWALADAASKKELTDMLAPLSGGDSGWRFMANEILAYADFRDGHLPEAQKEFEQLSNQIDAPEALRQRTKAMATLIRTGVGNYGTVPPPDSFVDAPPDKSGASVPPPAAPAGKAKAKAKKGKSKT